MVFNGFNLQEKLVVSNSLTMRLTVLVKTLMLVKKLISSGRLSN